MADEWPNNVGSYGFDPVTTLQSKLLGYLDVGPKSYMEHIKESEAMNVPFESSAIDRAEVAYKKAADFYDRTSLAEEDSAIKRALGLSLVLGSGTQHQLSQGLQNIRKRGLLGGLTSDNWAPNFIDWVSGSKAVLDRHFGDNDTNLPDTNPPVWDPSSKIYSDIMSYDK